MQSEGRFVIEARLPEDGEWVPYAEGYSDANRAHKQCDRLREKYPYGDWRVRRTDGSTVQRGDK